MLILYGFIGFAILSPLISVLTKDPIFLDTGLLSSLLFVLVIFSASRPITFSWRGIFSHLKEGEATKTWLLLHSLFTSAIGNIYPLVAVISSMTPLFVADFVHLFPETWLFAWMISLFSIIGLWALHLIIGMGYRWFCKGTMIGIQSFTSLAIQHLRNKQRKGIAYLLKAFLLLRDCLKHEELELQELNDAIKATRCFLQFKSEIPYDSLEMVAVELERFPSLEHLPRALSTFNRSTSVQWTGRFAVTQRTKRSVLELLVIVATVLSGLTFLPETTRSSLLEILQSAGSTQNIQIVMGFFLLIVTVYISMLVEPYKLSPFEAKRFTLSETK